MGVYIKVMEIPKNEPLLVKINPDGSVSTTARNDYRKYEAISVTEPHGRLGDLDELHNEAVRKSEKARTGTHDIWYNCVDRVICALDIKNAPTIIPASEEET